VKQGHISISPSNPHIPRPKTTNGRKEILARDERIGGVGDIYYFEGVVGLRNDIGEGILNENRTDLVIFEKSIENPREVWIGNVNNEYPGIGGKEGKRIPNANFPKRSGRN